MIWLPHMSGRPPANIVGVFGDSGRRPATITRVSDGPGRRPANVTGVFDSPGRRPANVTRVFDSPGRRPARVTDHSGNVGRPPASPFAPGCSASRPLSNRLTYAHDRLTDIQQTAPPIGIDGAVGLSAITGSDLFRKATLEDVSDDLDSSLDDHSKLV